MLFERTCRIAQDFDWFLRFVLQNSVEKRKNSKNHPESCIQKQAARFLSPACFGMFEPSKALSMLLFVIPVNHTANAAQFRLRCQNRQESSRKLHKKQAARFFRLPAWGCLSRQRLFPCFFAMLANQNANAAQLRLRCQNRQESIRKLHKNRQHDFFRLPAWECLSHQRRFSCFCL